MSTERERRWRLLLGVPPETGPGVELSADDAAMDAALAAVYDDTGGEGEARGAGEKRSAGLGSSAPRVARWLGDIRTYFPSRVVQVMQADAIDRLGLTRLLLEPEMLRSVEPDVHLVATLASLSRVIPAEAKETAHEVVATVVREVERRLSDRLHQAVRGALNRAARTNRPRPGDIDWTRTIAANLKNYLPEYRTVIPERLIGYGRKQTGFQREVVLVVDQSGSMATSAVYAGIFSSVLASIRTLKTHLVVYDTSVADLTDLLSDPVEVIFGTQLGGGTDTSKALAYCEALVQRPRDTVMVLISDLYDSDAAQMKRRLASFKQSGVTVVALLALSDEGTPSFERGNAEALAAMGIPAFACTPDAFPDLMALAINRGDIAGWVQAEQQARAAGPS
ncbi:MAG: VWA domain-containing protein [Propionibacteriaceae bacterium]|nr:VWA domain-containing protein [Propionibacteriaceae bacterium]